MSAATSRSDYSPAESQNREKIEKLRRGYTAIEPSPPPGFAARDSGVEREDGPVEWAIIVNHGMGQQVHFETLEGIALSIRNAEIRDRGDARPIATRAVKLKTFDGRPIELVRAEMNVGPEESPHRVHVYESYWAPLTEGNVSLYDVLKFLGEAALNGIGYLILHLRYFDRWVFGRMRKFPIHPVLTLLKIAFALFLFAPVILASLLTVAQASHILWQFWHGTSSAGSFATRLFSFVTPFVAEFEGCMLAFIVGTVLLPKIYRSKMLNAEVRGIVAGKLIVKFTAMGLSFGALIGVVWIEVGLVLASMEAERKGAIPAATPLILWRLLVVWVAATLIALVSRWFLVEYMGDVAAYVSSNKLSKFEGLGEAIKKSVLDVMGGVYSARTFGARASQTEQDESHQYRKIIVAGHSLGSVISYDLLNQLLLEDELAMRQSDLGRDAPRNIRDRTKLLLTFGSPLDKIAYLFRIKGDTDELRESAASAWQPLIRSYRFRPEKWVNIYSWMDFISAPLHFYDNPSDEADGGSRRVVNCRDQQAWVPLVAHTEYWTDDITGLALYNTVLGRPWNQPAERPSKPAKTRNLRET